MAGRVRAFRFVSFLFLTLLPAAAPAADFPGHPFVPGELIVAFKAGTSAATEGAVHARVGAAVVRQAPVTPVTLVRFDSSVPIEDVEAAYLADPSVDRVERNWLGRGGLVPDDTWYGEQWQHHNIGQMGGTPGADIESEPGWDLAEGSSSVVVAVLDTGIDSDHPELAGRIVPGWDFVNNDADPEDDNGHGTHVTGLLAANSDNAFGVAGVDHACMIMPVKVVGANNMGTIFDLISGIDFAAAAGVDVLSMSLIDYPLTTNLNQSLKAARQTGAILVACAGNGGIGDADVSAPGSSGETISIGATGPDDVRASYSGTGQKLDYVAPGDGVVTVVYDSSADDRQYFAGCSAATPIAAGIVSILKSLDPTLVTRQVRTYLTAGAEDQVGDPLEDTPGWDEYMGNGRVNLRATIQAYLDDVVSAAPDVAVPTGDLDLAVHPNPTSGAVTVSLTLPAAGPVREWVYDVAGRRVRELVRGARPAGPLEIAWDGRDESGARAAAGAYFVRAVTREGTAMRKVVLTR